MKLLVKSLFALAFFFLFANSGFAAGAGQEGWATVDTRLLIILHPEMESFDYVNQKFYRPGIAKKKSGEIQDEIEKARKQATPMLEEMANRQAEFTNGRTNLFLEKERKIQEVFNPGQTTEAKERERIAKSRKEFAALNKENPPDQLTSVEKGPIAEKERNRLMKEIENEFDKLVASYDAQLEKMSEQVLAVQETMYSPVFLTTQETLEKLRKIKKEITELISQTAAENKISVVMDTSFSMREIRKSTNLGNIPLQPEYGDIVSSALFHEFSNWEVPTTKFYNAEGKELPQQHGAGATAYNKTETLQKYLQLRNYLRADLAEFTPGQIFIVGGLDLTPMVAKKIISRYPVPDPVKNGYLSLINTFMNFEKTRYQAPEPPLPK